MKQLGVCLLRIDGRQPSQGYFPALCQSCPNNNIVQYPFIHLEVDRGTVRAKYSTMPQPGCEPGHLLTRSPMYLPLEHGASPTFIQSYIHNIQAICFAQLADHAFNTGNLILYVDLVTEYNHGEMMWQPNTPTTPGKDFYPLIKIKFSQLCLMHLLQCFGVNLQFDQDIVSEII